MIQIRNSHLSYGLIAIVLHWVMALLVLALISSGLYMVDLDYYSEWYYLAPWWHKGIGIVVFILLLIRLVWRLNNIAPEALSTYSAWELKLAHRVYFLFYVLLLIISASGYFISTYKGVGIDFFSWLKIPAVAELNTYSADIVAIAHEVGSYFLIFIFILHFSAAIKHHFYDKDITLIRMLKIQFKKGKKYENF